MPQKAEPSTPPALTTPRSPYDLRTLAGILQSAGQRRFTGFRLHAEDKEPIEKLLVYFLRYESEYERLGIDPNKGVMLMGGIGVGKTTLMQLMTMWANYEFAKELQHREPYLVIDKSQEKWKMFYCRKIAEDYVSNGMSAITRHTSTLFENKVTGLYEPHELTFDDLGREGVLKTINETQTIDGRPVKVLRASEATDFAVFGGNYAPKRNVMAEIIQNRYEKWISDKRFKTHFTTNLTPHLIQDVYGDLVRSRLREMCNVIKFNSEDKRK